MVVQVWWVCSAGQRQTDDYNTKSLAMIRKGTIQHRHIYRPGNEKKKKERVVSIHTRKERRHHKKLCECIVYDIHIHNYKIILGRYKSVGLCIWSLIARCGRGRNVRCFSSFPLVLTSSLIGLLHRSLTGSTHSHLGVVVLYTYPQGFDFVRG